MTENRKNYNIELLRIIACVYVICIHLLPTYAFRNGTQDYAIFIFKALNRVAVPSFFVITGFFWDSKKSVVAQYKHFVVRVLVPTGMTIIGAGVFLPILLHYVLGMEETILTIPAMLKLIFSGRLEQFPFCFHLWYIVELVKCYLALPVLQLLCSEDRHIRRVRHYLMGLFFVGGILLFSLKLSFPVVLADVFTFVPITIYMWFVLAGYELRVWMECHTYRKLYCWFGLALYLFFSSITCFFTWTGEATISDALVEQYYHYAFFSVVFATIGFVLFILYLPIKREIRMITVLGKATFGIYLIHPVVYSVIWHLKIEQLLSYVDNFPFAVLYVGLTFFLSFILVWAFEYVINIVKEKGFHR